MKICFIVDSHENTKMGLFYSAHNRIKQFQSHGHDIEVLSFQKYHSGLLASFRKKASVEIKTKNKSSFTYEGITYTHIWYHESFLSYILEKASYPDFFFSRFAKKVSSTIQIPDIIYAHWGLECGLFAMKLAKHFQKPYVVCYHGSDIHSTPSCWLPAIKRVLNHSAANIFVSQHLLNLGTQIHGEIKNSHIIYNGYNSEAFCNRRNSEEITKLKKKLAITNKVVGFVGNLETVKNAALLPTIFEKVFQENKNTHFIIAGDGSLRKGIEEECREKKLPVIFIGRVGSSEISSLMNVIDILTLPSQREGLPLVIIEGVVSGAVCLATSVGGLPEILPTEYLVDQTSEEWINTFVQKINKYISDTPEDISAFNIYSWEQIYQIEKQLLQHIIGR